MSAEVLTFQHDLAAFAQKLDLNVGTLMQKVSLDIFGDIVQRTPVDTGRARAGWALTVGEPSDYEPPVSTVDTTGLGTGEPKDPQFAEPPKADVSNVDGTAPVWIVNNVVYIQPLEDGHSRQAPAGMVKLALIKAEILIAEEAAKLE